MLSNNHNSCAFAEEIVSYIYGEATAKERGKFEAHLPNCMLCAEEIAGFGLVRSSIGEWRKDEMFAHSALEIPEFQTVETTKSSWFGDLRKLFTFSPAWAAGFAAVIVCIGLVWIFSSNSKQEVASNTSTETAPVAPIIPTNQNNGSITESKEEKADITPFENNSKPAPKFVKEVQPKISAPKNNPVRASNNAPKSKSVKPDINESMAKNLNKTNKTNNIQKTPRLSDVEGDEDNSLRLAELFDEIDSK